MDLITSSLFQITWTVLLFFSGIALSEVLVYLFVRKILRRRSALIPMLLAPALLGMACLVFYPLIYSIILSFSNMNLRHFRNPDFSAALGWRNLMRLFTEPVLREVRIYTLFFRTALWSFIQIALQAVLAIKVWAFEFNYTFCAVNLLLRELLGVRAMIHWMSSPFWNYTAMTIVNQWLGFPSLMVIISSAMKSIPPEMYEASELEGASASVRVFSNQIPLL
ncbi:MAG: sugar ABC transporter permease [Spirochaetales bacterium]|nr:sugar ABC transporter permease [Spirochaetales bacterium]